VGDGGTETPAETDSEQGLAEAEAAEPETPLAAAGEVPSPPDVDVAGQTEEAGEAATVAADDDASDR
jgi:hypothetical protein